VTIERSERRYRFTDVDNVTVEDERLSFKALGLLTYILSKPDHWITHRDQLANSHADGEHAVASALRELEHHGYIERHRERGEGGRFVWRKVVHEVSTTARKPRDGADQGKRGETPGETIARFTTNGKPRDVVSTEAVSTEVASTSAAAADDTRPEIDELCALLAKRVGEHRESPPSAVTATWRNDMRLLVDRGPTGQSKPTPTPPERVANAITYVFDHLADTNGTGFCWADQIRSPGALRRHLPSVRLAAKRIREGSSHGDSSMPAESWPTGGAA
jgi:hypothetical protein